MHRLIRFVTLSLVLVAACSAPAESPEPAVEAGLPEADDRVAIEALIAAWDADINAADVDALVASFTDDALRMVPNGPTLVGKEAIRAALQAEFDVNTIETVGVVEEIRVAEDWAFVRGTYSDTVTPKAGGDPTQVQGKWVSIVHRQADGTWKWHRDIWNNSTQSGVSSTQDAQEPSAWVAVETCTIKPMEGPALRAALREYVEYAVAHPFDAPGRVYGGFRQRVMDTANFGVVLEIESIADWEAGRAALFEALRNDEQRRTLRQAYRSHFVPQSCEWTFHQRWP